MIIRNIQNNRVGTKGNLYEFVISDESIDRHGTVIKSTAWNIDNFNKNGIVGYMHDVHNINDVNKIIGKGSAKLENKSLIGLVEFEPKELNPLAATVKGKVDFGSLSATSVGFVPKSGHWGDLQNDEDPEIYYFDDVELLEFSIVNVPSNPNALKRNIDIDNYLKGISKPVKGMPDSDYAAMRIRGTYY